MVGGFQTGGDKGVGICYWNRGRHYADLIHGLIDLIGDIYGRSGSFLHGFPIMFVFYILSDVHDCGYARNFRSCFRQFAGMELLDVGIRIYAFWQYMARGGPIGDQGRSVRVGSPAFLQHFSSHLSILLTFCLPHLAFLLTARHVRSDGRRQMQNSTGKPLERSQGIEISVFSCFNTLIHTVIHFSYWSF